MQTSLGHAGHYYSHIVPKTPVLQYGHATAIKAKPRLITNLIWLRHLLTCSGHAVVMLSNKRCPCTQRMQTSLAHADHYSLIIIISALQCGHATVIEVSKQALREHRPPWPMEIIIPQGLWIIMYTTISGKNNRVQHM